MKTQKMSLANIKGKLSRAEMKNIMAGSGGGSGCSGSNCSYGSCTIDSGACKGATGQCSYSTIMECRCTAVC